MSTDTRRRGGVASCRKCPVYCERVVQPAGCFEAGCPMLYSYDEDGRRYFGCMQRVFDVEVDMRRFRDLERTRSGFGGLLLAREPLPVCRVGLEQSHPDRADGPCRDPEFLFTVPRRGPDGERVVDRDG